LTTTTITYWIYWHRKSKNSIIFHAGMGKDGLSTRSDGAKHEVREQYEPIGGITYCRDADERLAVCGTGMTNNTFTFGIKLDF
jgi:hypothetical protein